MSTLQDCLDVLGEVIQSQNQKGQNYEPTPTDYFQVITHVLTTNGAAFQEKLGLMLQVYQAILPQATSSLVAKQFPVILKTLMTIAKDNADNTTILSLSISCLGELLVAQRDLSDGFWSQLSVLQAGNAIIAFIDDENPKLRKASHSALLSLLSSHKQANCLSFRSYFTEFILNVFSSCTRNAYHRSHCLVVLLESCFLSLPEKSILSVIEAMLKLQLCEVSKLTSAIFRTLDAFYQNPSFLSLISATNVEKIVSSSLSLIMENTPKTNDIEALCHYLNVITNGYLLLMKVLPPASLSTSTAASSLLSSNFERILSIFFTYCSTIEFTQIHCAIAMNLKRITNSWLQYGSFQPVIEQWYRDLFIGKKSNKQQQQQFQPQDFMTLMSSSASASSSSSVPLAVKGIYWIISFYDRILVLKFSYCWIFLLESLRSFLDSSLFYSSPIPLPSLPSTSSTSNSTKDLAVYLLKGIVLKLGDIQTAVSQQVINLNSNSIMNEIWQTLIKFLSIFTLIPFLSIIPLIEMSEDTSSSASLITRDWVFQLLGEELKHLKCKLADFVFCILPIASKLHKLITFFKTKVNTTSTTATSMDTDNKGLTTTATTALTYEKQITFLTNKLYALWKLLPDICYGEILDLEIAFPKMIAIFQDTLNENEYDRLPSMIILSLKHIAEGFLIQKHYVTRGTDEKIRKVFGNSTSVILPMILKHMENVSFSNVEFQEIISCFHIWIQLTNEQLLNNITKKLLQLVLINTTIPSFNEGDGDDGEEDNAGALIEMEQTEKAAKYMSVLLTIVPFMSSSLILILYKTIYPLLSFTSPEGGTGEGGEGAMEEEDNEEGREYHSHLLTKRAYNLLYALINHHSKILFSQDNHHLTSLQLLTLLNHSLLSTQVSVRNQRLRCLLILLTQHILPHESKETLLTCFQLMLGELLICLKDNNGKTRAQTMEILKLFSRHLSKLTVFQSLLSGILSETSTMRSSTITALSFHLLESHKALYEYQQDRIEEGEDISEAGDHDDDDEEEEDKENDSEAAAGRDDSDMESENEEPDDHDEDEEEEVLDITSSSHSHSKKVEKKNERKSRSNTIDDSSSMMVAPSGSKDGDEETPLTHYTELVELGLQTLSSLYLLCSQEIVEQTKAILVYMKVIIILSTKEQLSSYLQSIVYTIHRQLGPSLKSKFTPKIRAIFRKLLRKFSESELRSVIPSSDLPLFDYILKENRKSLKKKLAKKMKNQRWKEAVERYQRNGDRSLLDRLTAEEGEDEFDDNDLDVQEEGLSALPTFGSGKTVKGGGGGGKSTVKGGSVISRKTGKGGVGTTTVAGRSIKSRFDLEQDVDDDDDDMNEDGDRETDYRFQSKSRVKGLTFNDFQSIHPSSLNELVSNKVSKKRLLGKEHLSKGKNKRLLSLEEETAEHDDYKDDDNEDDEEEEGEGDMSGRGGDMMNVQNNKRRAFGSKGKSDNNVNNPFPAMKQMQSSSSSSSNKKQRLNNSSSLSLSHMNLNPSASSVSASSHDNERYQVVITKEGKVKVTEKPTELFSADPSFDQLTSKTKTMKGGKSITGMSIVGRNGQQQGQQQSQRKEKVQKKSGLRLKEPGIEYRAKKAGGDVWKKGQAVQPHAFIPLDPRLLSRKHHNQAVEHFGVVVNNNQKESRKKYKVVNKRGGRK
jgi:hypothetical protein